MKQLFLLLITFIFFSVSNSFGQSHIQTTSNYIGLPGAAPSTTIISKAFAASSTTGNLIVVHLDGLNNYTFPPRTLAPGLYVISVSSTNNVLVRKVIVK